jgi:hypothetical protein
MLIIPEEIPAKLNPWRCNFDYSKTERIIASGNDIVNVTDMFNTGITLSQSVSGNRPKTGLATQNGLNVASFTAASRHFLNFSVNTPLNVPFTVFVVGQSNSTAAIQNFIGRQTGAINGQWTLRRESSGGVFNTFGYGVEVGSSQTAKTSNDNANIHTVYFASGVGNTYILNNGSATSGAVRTGQNPNVGTAMALGANNNTGVTSLDGWIGEVIIYGFILSSAQIAGISRYLSRKWGITIS